ncbi:1248_t:CDS:2, partial [Cetraspora pellucida]
MSVPKNTFFSQKHNSILTDAEADKFDNEAYKMNEKIVRKLEVYEEANKVINEETEIETLTNEELEQADDLNNDLFQDFTP